MHPIMESMTWFWYFPGNNICILTTCKYGEKTEMSRALLKNKECTWIWSSFDGQKIDFN